VEENWQEVQSNLRTSHDKRIREVLQESSHSSMYKVYDNVIFVRKEKKLRCCELPALYSLVPDYFFSWSFSHAIDRIFTHWLFIFLQVKKEPRLPWVYSWIRHRCEQIEPNCESFLLFLKLAVASILPKKHSFSQCCKKIGISYDGKSWIKLLNFIFKLKAMKIFLC
jgi:hypothetical protein